MAYLQGKDLFVQDCYAGADQEYRLPIRVITEYAWHSLFAHQLFIRPTIGELASHYPHLQVVCVPGFEAKPARRPCDRLRAVTYSTPGPGVMVSRKVARAKSRSVVRAGMARS